MRNPLTMRTKILMFVLLALATPTSLHAQTEPASLTNRPHLQGLTAAEAQLLIAKLQDAQRSLVEDRFQSFELLAGSISSYDATQITLRRAFLDVDFSKLSVIERDDASNRLWQSFKLAYTAGEKGRLYWDIEAVLGSTGKLERVVLLYKPPAPF